MPHEKSISRSLGEFFGHIWKGVKEPVDKPEAGAKKIVVRQEQTEREMPQPEGGRVVLRRTVIEEIEHLPPEQKP